MSGTQSPLVRIPVGSAVALGYDEHGRAISLTITDSKGSATVRLDRVQFRALAETILKAT